MALTIDTTAGFNVMGGLLGLLLGGIWSVPWVIALTGLIWLYGEWIERHSLVFAMSGPPIVCAISALIGPPFFLKFVAISCVASSVAYLVLSHWRRMSWSASPRARGKT